jgi:insulysin
MQLYCHQNVIEVLFYYNNYIFVQPARYLAHLLGHEGKGSLLSALKRRGWCSHLDAGSRRVGRDMAFFVVSVDLTEEGNQHTDDIVDLIFQVGI